MALLGHQDNYFLRASITDKLEDLLFWMKEIITTHNDFLLGKLFFQCQALIYLNDLHILKKSIKMSLLQRLHLLCLSVKCYSFPTHETINNLAAGSPFNVI